MKSSHDPIFIVCTGRSGSTLLRYILDAHDMIDAPQELHLGAMIKEMIRVTGLLHEGRYTGETDFKELVRSVVESQIESLMRSSLKSEIWCDKSISSIDYLEEIMYVFPNARYIFLYRDCLDFVHSALEVSKYGFTGFGFEDFVLKNPTNIVDGLVNYWSMQSEKRIALQDESNFAIHSVKYEDIVHHQIPTIQSLFEFLKLPFDPKIVDNIFTKFKPGRGDHKVQSSNKIINNTGKGIHVPLKHINETSFLRMNNVLQKLGYPEIDRNHNFSIGGTTLSDDLLAYSKKRVYDYLSESLENNAIPLALADMKLSFEIADIEDSSWILDLQNKKIVNNFSEDQDEVLVFKLRLDSMLKIIDKKLNITWGFREGLVETNTTYENLNEVGKYLF